MFSLELPQRGNSTEYIQYTISQYEKENHRAPDNFLKQGVADASLEAKGIFL